VSSWPLLDATGRSRHGPPVQDEARSSAARPHPVGDVQSDPIERRFVLNAQQTLIGGALIVGFVAAEYGCSVWAARVGRRAGSDDPVWQLLGLFFSVIGVLTAYGYAWSRRAGRNGTLGAVLAFVAGWAVFVGGVYVLLIRG
jgi:hypothetical protein